MLLENKVAIVTGGSKGIGRGIAVKFAMEGCHVVIADVDLKESEITLDEVKKMGREGLVAACDITNSDQVRELIKATVNKFGQVDILVNNAGMGANAGPTTSVATIPEDEWDKVVAINLKGAFLCCKEVVPLMKEKGNGIIINLSSLGAVHPPGVHPHYHAAKAGILGLTYDMARELGPSNIRVNAIMPGPIRTPFYDPIVKDMSDEEKTAFFDMLNNLAPLRRMGTPEDIAGAALFLASELSAFVTGAVIPVTGGLPLQPSNH
ncbi:MAG: SDR family NAD(P)-dependent oxidoreductase [Desulfotomaculaceae bacterium]